MKRYKFTFALILVGLLVASVGCSSRTGDQLAVHVTTGQIQFEGQPLPGSLIVLHPKDRSNPKLLPAVGKSDAAGNFTLTTYKQNDGAIAGEYAVTVEYSQLVQNGDEIVNSGNLVPPQYVQANTTELQVRVADGLNQLPVLNLHR